MAKEFKKTLMVQKLIRFRPHHFMCSLGYEGKGYSYDFVQNYNQIIEKLRSPNGDQTLIQVTEFTDDVCSPCPRREKKLCQRQKFIESLDKKHKEALGLAFDQVLSWKDAKTRIKKNISVERFHELCKGCEWKDLGLCEKALKKILTTTD